MSKKRAVNVQKLLKAYEKGGVTLTGLILRVLGMVNESNVSCTVEGLPPEIRRELRSFVDYYGPTVLIFNAPRPSEAAVHLVREWFAHHAE
jgi:hypothetical protein